MGGSQTTKVVRVMLVGKYPVLRQSLREIVEREADLAVVAEARDVEEAVVAARALQPDVVVLDASMAKEEGITALRQSPVRKRVLRVICISITCDREHVIHALRAGACGFLRTEDAAEELVPALRGACLERPYLGAAVNREEILSLLAQGAKKLTLLVIEDDSEIAEAARAALEAAGYEVFVVADSQEGLRLVQSTRPDGIILDVKVPACSDGFHFVWELRKDADTQIRNTPVLVVASVNEELSPGARSDDPDALWKPYEYLPVQDFIRRPLQAGQLLDKVRSLVPARTAH
jgi:DNA-binding NarL/FixJ family response regulator